MTIDQIKERVTNTKPVSDVTLRRYLKRLGIRPIGTIRTRPAVYPEDAAAKILKELGYEKEADQVKGLVSLRRLQHERRKSVKARAAR